MKKVDIFDDLDMLCDHVELTPSHSNVIHTLIYLSLKTHVIFFRYNKQYDTGHHDDK